MIKKEISECVLLDLKYSKGWNHLELDNIDNFYYIKGKFVEDVRNPKTPNIQT